MCQFPAHYVGRTSTVSLWLDLHLLTLLGTEAILRMTHRNHRRWLQQLSILHPKPYSETPNGRASHEEHYAGLLLFLKCLPVTYDLSVMAMNFEFIILPS